MCLIIEQGKVLLQFYKDIIVQFFDMVKQEQEKLIQCMVQLIIISLEELFQEQLMSFFNK